MGTEHIKLSPHPAFKRAKATTLRTQWMERRLAWAHCLCSSHPDPGTGCFPSWAFSPGIPAKSAWEGVPGFWIVSASAADPSLPGWQTPCSDWRVSSQVCSGAETVSLWTPLFPLLREASPAKNYRIIFNHLHLKNIQNILKCAYYLDLIILDCHKI